MHWFLNIGDIDTPIHPKFSYENLLSPTSDLPVSGKTFWEFDITAVVYSSSFLARTSWLCRLKCLFVENLAILALGRGANATDNIPSARDVDETTNLVIMYTLLRCR